MYKEGKAVIKYTKDSFLNPDARISRDISIAFARSFLNKKSEILDPTAATGIRGIRYYLEVPSKEVTLLDINKKALSSIKKNLIFNKIKANGLGQSIQEFANTTDKKFELIDLDPFGGITPYIHDLMKISKNDSYMLVTATDAAVLCGADYKACVRLYDAKPMHNELCHEVGLRILIGYITRVAAQFNFGVEVLVSFSYLHYVRVFFQLKHGSKSALESIKKLGYVYYCNRCLYRSTHNSTLPNMDKCKNCGNLLDISGKLWLGNIYNKNVMELIILDMEKGVIEDRYDKKSLEFLKSIYNELDIPLYYSIPKITKKMKISSVGMVQLMDKLEKRGFSVSRTHMGKLTIKTNADIEDIKKVLLSA